MPLKQIFKQIFTNGLEIIIKIPLPYLRYKKYEVFETCIIYKGWQYLKFTVYFRIRAKIIGDWRVPIKKRIILDGKFYFNECFKSKRKIIGGV